MPTTTDNPGQGQPPRQGRSRGGAGKFIRSQDTARSDARACELRSAGQTYQQIADELGYSDPSAAKKAVDRALASAVAEPAGRLRTLELARLDAALQVAFRVLHEEHVAASFGKLIIDPRTGKPVRDNGPNLQAIDRIVKIGERRAKLLGLDAAVKVEAVTVDAVEAEIRRFAEQIGMEHFEGTA